MNLRENWRVLMLVVFVLVSTVALFGPLGGGDDGASSDGLTNLEYGLDLDGGTRIRAPLVGQTVTDLNITSQEQVDRIERELTRQTSLDPLDIRIRTDDPGNNKVEIYSDNVSKEAFAGALRSAGFDVTADDVRDGVTETTRQQTVDVLNSKISQGGITGGRASTTRNPVTGEHFVMVEVPGADAQQVRDLIGTRGVVRVVAHFPVTDDSGQITEHRNVTVLRRGTTENDFESVGPPQQGQGDTFVSVTLRDEVAANFSNAMQEYGFTTGSGIGNCDYNVENNIPGSYCLYTISDGRIVHAASMGDLADSINQGTFVDNPTFRINTQNLSEAQRLSINLQAGALPTELDFENEQVFSIDPSLGQRFKGFALLTGLIAWLGVSVMVFLRYNSPRVAIPMLLTAAAEVFLLLGFASAINLSLDLSHIAGFIAVIGTGVDDLIIIADEIIQEEGVATGKVFQSRFRRAFWVIGAAAVTTIIAMSPLAVLGLGDLTGFAIVTIVGVLIGVLVTRPAYGDILRNFMVANPGSD